MWRLAGGSQRLCLKMARELGDRVLLKAPVRGIVQDGGTSPCVLAIWRSRPSA